MRSALAPDGWGSPSSTWLRSSNPLSARKCSASVGPHALRATAATNALDHDADIAALDPVAGAAHGGRRVEWQHAAGAEVVQQALDRRQVLFHRR